MPTWRHPKVLSKTTDLTNSRPCAQLDQLLAKLDEQLALLRQATPLLRARAAAMADPTAAAVRTQLAAVLDQQTDAFEGSMRVLSPLSLSFT